MLRALPEEIRGALAAEYARGRRRLLLLDYDGTLRDFVANPDEAWPDEGLRGLLAALGANERNEVVVISGRNRGRLTEWLGDMPVHLVAEHGAWIRRRGQEWRMPQPYSSQWKEVIRPILEGYVDRTPGATIEEKEFGLTWHYRRADPELGAVQARELRDAVQPLTANLDLGVYEGHKLVEVKNVGINKGRATELWLGRETWDFILALGDDYTDEDLFAVLPARAYSIRVGHVMSRARYNLDSVWEVRRLLEQLAGTESVC